MTHVIFWVIAIPALLLAAFFSIREEIKKAAEKAAKEKRIASQDQRTADLDAEKRRKNFLGDLARNTDITYSDVFERKAKRLVSAGYKPVAFLDSDFSYREISYIKRKDDKRFVIFEQNDLGEIVLTDII